MFVWNILLADGKSLYDLYINNTRPSYTSVRCNTRLHSAQQSRWNFGQVMNSRKQHHTTPSGTSYGMSLFLWESAPEIPIIHNINEDQESHYTAITRAPTLNPSA